MQTSSIQNFKGRLNQNFNGLKATETAGGIGFANSLKATETAGGIGFANNIKLHSYPSSHNFNRMA